MTTLVRIHRKGQMTLPSSFRSALGVGEGDTPAQRRAIDRGIAISQRQFKQGRGFGPFETAEALVASLHRHTAKPNAEL